MATEPGEGLVAGGPAHSIHFDIFTLFPSMFCGPLSESILKRAQEKGLLSVALHDIRAYTTDRHHICDDTPYGGGGGMIMKPEPIFRAVETVLTRPPGWQLPPEDAFVNLPPWDPEAPAPLPADVPIILLTPQGRRLNQAIVTELSHFSRLALICGRYEGVDERVRTQLVSDEISIGDYVLSGGELAAMVLVDAITRLVPGVLGYAEGAQQDSYSPGLGGLLEGPQYTRPYTFRGEQVPDILLSGHHGHVARWRREQALLRTLQRRPDLLQMVNLSEEDRAFLRRHGWQPAGREETDADKEERI
ncbi:tRNA (guanosine(37)-N1)-methyltransferase TrmD [Litorilinea aerophila]|nr:tRNA (guanosine(37)-N1)-methyltransferase TrmD [Litorilinea aerophila]MCC9076990.1 tRNA (guanosine(37)-N1)-methyltransferase TrmD [Litorilinea aerophila]